MTTLTILLALVIAHFATGLASLRRYDPVVAALTAAQKPVVARWPEQGWLGVLVLVVIVALISVLAELLASALLGSFGLFLLALVVLLYTLGPDDLDIELGKLARTEDDDERNRRISDFGHTDLPPAARTFRAALYRWFGVIFWFALLGIAGALLFRLAEQARDSDEALPENLAGAMERLRAVLAWPVAQLMSLALMLVADFDRSWRAWKQWLNENGWLTPGDGMLLAAGEQAVAPDEPIPAMLRALELCWRMLITWLVVLSVMLIVGWIA